MKKKAILLEVIWNDISTYGGWHQVNEVDTLMTVECCSVGYLVGRTNKLIRIAQSLTKGKEVGDITVIPLTNVKKIRRLR